MRRLLSLVAILAALVFGVEAHAATMWVEGRHYFAVRPPQPTDAPPGKIEVIEVFSYGCPYCYQLYPTIDKLKAALPKNVELNYLPASFNPGEDWPMFQRAFYAAQALGILDKTHDALFDAVWKSSELAIVDAKTNRLKSPLPTIENVAAFYSRVAGVKREDVLAAAKSFGVEVKMQRADDRVKAYRVDGTPTILVNGKYSLSPSSAGGYDELIELVKWLVAKESK
jgi:protein dithiol oxidoreductase (disulfide-forming)